MNVSLVRKMVVDLSEKLEGVDLLTHLHDETKDDVRVLNKLENMVDVLRLTAKQMRREVFAKTHPDLNLFN